MAEAQVDAEAFQTHAEVAQGFAELLLAGNPLGQVELPADFPARLEQADPMPALGGHAGGGEPAGPAPITAMRFCVRALR